MVYIYTSITTTFTLNSHVVSVYKRRKEKGIDANVELEENEL
jgi:hypothetical protein